MAVGSLSDYAENLLLDYVLGNPSFAATLYLALFTTLPAETGMGGVEVSGGAYTRLAIPNNPTYWPAAVAGAKGNGVVLTFPMATTPWGTIAGWGLYDAPTGGNLLFYGKPHSGYRAFTVDPSTDTLTVTSGTHSFQDGQLVELDVLLTGHLLPSPITMDTPYYVVNRTPTTLQLSTTSGGPPIDLTTPGTGVSVGLSFRKPVNQYDTMSIQLNALGISLL